MLIREGGILNEQKQQETFDGIGIYIYISIVALSAKEVVDHKYKDGLPGLGGQAFYEYQMETADLQYGPERRAELTPTDVMRWWERKNSNAARNYYRMAETRGQSIGKYTRVFENNINE